MSFIIHLFVVFLFYEKISQHIPYSFFHQRKQSFVLLALLAKLNKKLMASTNGLNIFFFYTQRYQRNTLHYITLNVAHDACFQKRATSDRPVLLHFMVSLREL